ncbi:ABC transporter permease subunit [Modestobacter sp. I12A-02628]|uniref:Sugar ABC transporter permease n=1 Tax=Goekera deserti TaxID=2497753 RepID=A0A7K3WB89_9ACTN|nr:sugar ABC transporter permease [Goekera deserti]MPQ97416.1 ABC transporter permease subunit [Goekera deserti]NDI47983.1 ABC transporter permease subunit [Goekera deserti]NEL53731.1 sugar ABC transporter permease [Goekera deserti]
MGIKIANALLAVLAGVGGAVAVFYLLNKLGELLPGRWEERVKPFLWLFPALAAIGVYLIYPTVQTIIFSFANASSTQFIGLSNYSDLLASSAFQTTLVNTLLWIIIVPAGTIVLGLLIATLADRLEPRAEKTAKTFIFLPLAVGAVSAGAIWRFVYAASPASQEQVGLLNGIVTGVGGDPVNWLQISSGKLNSFLLMVILMWLQAGFAMVLLSAAIKGVPVDTLEAARLDGAGEGAIFFRVVVPQIRTSLITVFITVLITVLKTFDIVYVMTNGNFGTNVIAVDFYNQLFTNSNAGYAAAIVVMLMLVMIPIMTYQIRQFRAEEVSR